MVMTFEKWQKVNLGNKTVWYDDKVYTTSHEKKRTK
uniref:Uncharacterized protein n=1 Tax=Vitis vinifera TaxID=29760 RepID=F6I5P3_VITVI